VNHRHFERKYLKIGKKISYK